MAEISEFVFYWTGLLVCLSAGALFSCALFSAAINCVWRKFKDAYSLKELIKAAKSMQEKSDG